MRSALGSRMNSYRGQPSADRGFFMHSRPPAVNACSVNGPEANSKTVSTNVRKFQYGVSRSERTCERQLPSDESARAVGCVELAGKHCATIDDLNGER